MPIFFTLMFVLWSNIAIASIKSDVYNCIFQYGKVKKIIIANKELLAPQKEMPMPATATSDPECYIMRNNRQKNTAFLDYQSSYFLNTVIADVAKLYKNSCSGKKCENLLHCKTLTQAIATSINQHINEDLKNYGRLAETEEIFKQIVKDDKECTKKIEGIYNSKRLMFYKDSKCVNRLSASQDNYIKQLIDDKKQSWSQEFINCLNQIKNG